MKKAYKIIKFILFVIASTLVFVFNEAIMKDEGVLLNLIVGLIMVYYGLEGILIPIFTKKVKKEEMKVLGGAINLLFAFTMLFFLEGNPNELRIVCVMWSFWSITREGEEIFEKAFHRIKRHPVTSIINLAESIVVIIFSLELICARSQHALIHHAHTHVILLAIELLLEVTWEHIDNFEELIIKKTKKYKKSKETTSI